MLRRQANKFVTLMNLFARHFAGVHAHAATQHCKQRETTKAQGEVPRTKKCFPRRTRKEGRETIAETKRGKEKDL